MHYIIYRLTNRNTGKIYVGITSTSLTQRLAAHQSSAKGGSFYILHQSIRKHGWSTFIVDHIFTAFDELSAKEMEKYFIAEYRSYGGGYNMTPGGDGHPCTPEIAEAISKAKKGKPLPWMIGHTHNNGFFWITDGITSMQCRDGFIPEGWRRGRINKVGPRLNGTNRPKFPNGYAK
jgi:group I intron endonuclease